MRLRFGRLALVLAGAAGVVAIATMLFLPREREAPRNFDDVTNDLCIDAPAAPFDPTTGLRMLDPRGAPAASRCPVCGMHPARYPRWAAQLIFRDGAAHFFDSPVDLFVFLQRVGRYDRRHTVDDVAVVFAKDFEGGQWIDARQAFFLHGSRLVGPMRDADLPAFASREAAAQRARRDGGEVLSYADITPERIQPLNRSVHHRHERNPSRQK